MRVPLSWLRSYCDPGLSTAELVDRLALTGTEAERVERVGVVTPEAYVVGKVVSVEAHPDADRLSVCQVDDGAAHPRTIVCGAPNVDAGQTVAVARPGALLPDGSELGEATLRGVRSEGMILAEDELGIGETVDRRSSDGIMLLADDLEPGTPLIEQLEIADEVAELEITPNRPDCLGVYGVARELHAATGATLAEDPTDADAQAQGSDSADDYCSIEIADPVVCLRFTARVFEDVKVGPSPPWLKARLSVAGQRPISNVVDITNYVMLTCGQPLHAFDLDKVRGGRIIVRSARDGERMTTLDGIERSFDSEIALVCDAEGPSGIAGIMGGAVSEVSEQTTRVLMEVATWVGPNILASSRRLGLRSEASARFEKQLHPDQALAAQRLAARLIVDLCGARLVPGTLDAYPQPLEPRVLELRVERLRGLLGQAVPKTEIEAILKRLGFGVEAVEGGYACTVPYWRDADVRREVDLIEEVVRLYGLERLPTTLPARRRAIGRLTPGQRLRRRLEDSLRDQGFDEVINWSFTSPAAVAALRLGERPLLELANPLSADQSVMRPLLLGGLLDSARHNAARERPDLALFESAHVYEPDGSLDAPRGSPGGARPTRERHHLAALLTGALAGGWRGEARAVDYYAAKGPLEAMLEAAGVGWSAEPAEQPFLHPGRAADVVLTSGECAGWIGELHPLVAQAWGFEGASAFELDADLLAAAAPGAPTYRELSSFPAVTQDIAVTVPDELEAAAVERAVREGAGELLARLSLFDVYRGDQVGTGNKSLALRLEFRAPDRTLTEDEIGERRGAIARELEQIGGKLRG